VGISHVDLQAQAVPYGIGCIKPRYGITRGEDSPLESEKLPSKPERDRRLYERRKTGMGRAPESLAINAVSREMGISVGTLERWRP
jgi:hypothetical protein